MPRKIINFHGTRAAADPTPVYFRLQSEIQKKIEDGRLATDAQIPPERRLAEKYRVSIGTVKKALLNLVNDGYLYRVQGRGTFVAGTTIRRENLKYYRLMQDFDREEAELTMKFVALKRVYGIDYVCRNMHLSREQCLFELKRRFFSAGKPIIYTVSYLPEKIFPGLDQYPVAKFEKMTLYSALEKDYGIPTIYNQELIGVTIADEKTAGMLSIEQGTLLTLIRMMSFTYRDVPYEYRWSYCLTESRGVLREY
jgi:GntR family transcriptional regulator